MEELQGKVAVVTGAASGIIAYILTHLEWNGMIRTRMDDILEDRHPTAGFLPT